MADTTSTAQPGQRSPEPGREHKRLEVFVGKWINEGQTVARADASSRTILTSDGCEWMPCQVFVLYTAYGRIGDMGVGDTEIISYDPASQTYRAHAFDNRGAISTDELTIQGDTWTWKSEKTGCTAIFTDGGKTQATHHVRVDDDGHWLSSMKVILITVGLGVTGTARNHITTRSLHRNSHFARRHGHRVRAVGRGTDAHPGRRHVPVSLVRPANGAPGSALHDFPL